MSLNSVNTNTGAMQALQTLNAINRELLTVQNRISTGRKIASPKDNPAVWAIAQTQRGESKALDAVEASLQRGQSAIDVALSAGESISDMLNDMKETMLAASDTSLSAQSKAALNDQYVSLRRQIDLMANNAEFGGVKLIAGGGSTSQIRALANGKGTSTIDVAHIDLSTGGAALAGLPVDLTGTIGTVELDAMTAGINAVNAAVSQLGTGSKSLDTHLTFVTKLQDTIDASVGRLVDADMARESANLQALQVRQQLAIYALSIANSQPSMLLQLFKRAA
jgi:flagellin